MSPVKKGDCKCEFSKQALNNITSIGATHSLYFHPSSEFRLKYIKRKEKEKRKDQKNYKKKEEKVQRKKNDYIEQRNIFFKSEKRVN